MAPRSDRPSFNDLVRNYPDPRISSVADIKRSIGGAIDDTRAPPAQQWLGGEAGDTCTIRMSRALNYSGVMIPERFPGFRTAKGRDRFNYGFAVQELHRWLIGRFGQPDISVRGKPVSRGAFRDKKGIILFDITFGINPDGRTRALGHADLWDGKTFYDEKARLSRPGQDFFKLADAVSLWVLQGSAMLPPFPGDPPDQ